MQNRITIAKAEPDLYKTVTNVDQAARELAKTSGMTEGFTYLIRLRVSQLIQCAICIKFHTRDALACGESNERVNILSSWKETAYFNAKERASLALCEAITVVGDGQVSDTIYADAAEVLTAQEVAAVEWLSVIMNTWHQAPTET